jgi:hypothetical protein
MPSSKASEGKKAPGKAKRLEQVVKEASAASNPSLVPKISNMPSGLTKFASKPSASAGIILEGIQRGALPVNKRTTPGYENRVNAQLGIGKYPGKSKLQKIQKRPASKLISVAKGNIAEQNLGNLIAVNQLLQRGNVLGAEVLSQRSKIKPTLSLPETPVPNLAGSAIIDPHQEKYKLVLEDVLSDPSNGQKYYEAIKSGQYDRYEADIVKKALTKARSILLIRPPHVERSITIKRSRKNFQPRDQLEDASHIELPKASDEEEEFLSSGKEEAKDPLFKMIEEATSSDGGGPMFRQYLGNKTIGTLKGILDRSHIQYPARRNGKEFYVNLILETLRKEPTPELFNEVFMPFVSGQGIRVAGRRSRKQNPSTVTTKPKQKPSLDVDNATTKLELILGEIGGGNDSKLMKNQAANLVQYLLLHKQITKEMAKQILTKVFNYK